mgnify:FL=1
MQTAGGVFVLLGLLGFFLPFLQGFLFLAIGIVLLSISSAGFRAWVETHTRRYPKFHAFVKRAESWVENIIGPVES